MPKKTRAGLCRGLTPILLHEVESGCSVARPLLPWTVFYSLMRLEERISPPSGEIMPSAEFLVTCHDYVGQMSRCNEGDGRLLLTLVDALTPLTR